MNEFYRSQCNFRQYKPPKSKWREFWDSIKKRHSKSRTLPRNGVDVRTNPYRREANKINWRARLAMVFLILSIGAWSATLLYLPYFRINKIVYLGLDFIKRDDIDDFIKNNLMNQKLFFIRDNYFLTNTSQIEEELNKKYSLNSVIVKKIFPHELRIDLEEKISTIIYDNGLEYYLLDNDGGALKYLAKAGNPETFITTTTIGATTTAAITNILGPTSSIASSTAPRAQKEEIKTHIPEYRKIKKNFGAYPIIYDTRNISTSERQKNIVTKKFIDNVLAFLEILQKEGIAIPRYMTMEHPLAGVMIYTDQPWYIYFQPSDNLNAQIVNLKAILKDNKVNEYIDLRFGDRVYWK